MQLHSAVLACKMHVGSVQKCIVCVCRRMWGLLQLHAKQCQSSDCPVPRCRELREMRRRQMSRQEDQRRHAYQAMLRQQAQARKQQQQPQSQSGQFPERSHTPGY